jgi:hypothetical protein
MQLLEDMLARRLDMLPLEAGSGESVRGSGPSWTECISSKRSRRSDEWFRAPQLLPKPDDWFEPSGFKGFAANWLRGRSVKRRVAVPSTTLEVIESSRWILDLEDDWDEQGAEGYSEATWGRACGFLARQATLARRSLGRDLPAPAILPGPKGSIDLHWKTRRFELLVNIPREEAKPATFYGDDYGTLCIRGNLNTSEEILGLVGFWLLV